MPTSKSYSLEESREKGNPEKASCPEPGTGGFWSVAAKFLELISQRHLNIPCRIQYVGTRKIRIAWNPESAVADHAVSPAKHVTVKCIGDVQFEGQSLAFEDSRVLNNRKIFVDVSRIS
jgi:hypothetical protein